MKFDINNIVVGGSFFCFSILSTYDDMLTFNFKICSFQGRTKNINIKVCNKFACRVVSVCLSVCHTWVQDNDWKSLKGRRADEDIWK